MTKRDPRQKIEVPTRTPKAKGGMFENLRKPGEVESIPFEELVRPAEGQGVRPPMPPSGGQTPIPVAPARDFNRRANSLDRDALPAGHFPGTSKKLYDALYLRTRGAVTPRRTIVATKRDLMKWSGVKNRKTLDAHMRYFDLCGLIRREWQPGQNEGYAFEVFLPEEIGLGDRPPVVVRPPEGTDQISDRGTDQKTGSGGQTQTADFQRTSGEPKTLLKTNTERADDEAAPLARALAQAEREVTGKVTADASKWEDLASVLVAEFKIVAARTQSVSSGPALLAEHLRRRLFKKDKAQLESEEKASPAPAALKIDASQCPDCGGSMWWYPNGYGQPVARCTHEALSKT